MPAYHLALAHIGLGNRDAAFALLEKACAEREPAVINLKVEPRFEPLRRDPRYARSSAALRLPNRGCVRHPSRGFCAILPPSIPS